MITLEQITALIENNQISHAKSALEQLYKQNPADSQVLHVLGVVELEALESGDSSDTETAVQNALMYFTRAVELQPDSGYEKYLYLGQLSTGFESVGYYSKGLDIMSREYESVPKDSEEYQIISKKACEALCSLIEIYMTDCCDAEDAEQKCEEYISMAISLSPNSPEVLSTLASIRISQCRESEAKDAIVKAAGSWIDSEAKLWPSFESRLTQAKILIEVKEFDLALRVIKTCQQENDEDEQVWYLFGWCYYMSTDPPEDMQLIQMEDGKLDLFEDARDCFCRVLQLFEQNGAGEVELVRHSEELLKYINESLGMNGREVLQVKDVVVEDMDDGEEWEDMDEEAEI